MSPEAVIGIDLGTTNSVVAVVDQGTPQLLHVQGQPLLPSVVGIGPQNDVLVGTPARNQWVVAPENTVRSVKRKMGSGERVSMAGSSYTPQEISAFILRELKQAAEQQLRHAVQRAVITVPAYFNEVQRQATLEAGEIAGLVVERILNEPTAAALAYGFGVGEDAHLRVLVYDLGGDTFDVSIIEMNYGVVDVLATAGDNHLGGDDFDERLAALVADEFQEKHKIDVNGILDVSVTERSSNKRVTERLKADRQRLSPDQISASQAKLALAYGDDGMDQEGEGEAAPYGGEMLDPGTHALLERARQAIARPDLDAELASDIRSTVEQIQLAAAAGDPDAMEQHCDELIDLLFEAEEE